MRTTVHRACACRHPQHSAIAAEVRGWFHNPYQGMGYRAERGRWGTYWSHGLVAATRDGRQMRYRLSDPRITPLIQVLYSEFCAR